MNRIAKAFAGGKAFIPFVTAGDPSADKTVEYILEMEKAGADLIELGIPFSDPTAEGPVIQAANLRALRGGMTTDGASILPDTAGVLNLPQSGVSLRLRGVFRPVRGGGGGRHHHPRSAL